MYYQRTIKSIEEYVNCRLTERERSDIGCLWDVIAEYISSCGLEEDEAKFIHKNGFSVWDFVDHLDLSDEDKRYYERLENVA